MALVEAELYVGLAERFHWTFDQIASMDARYIGMLKLHDMVHGQREEEVPDAA